MIAQRERIRPKSGAARWGAAIVVAGAVFGRSPRPALAEDADTARCRIQAIQALPKDGGLDDKLARLKPRLTRPPFAHWKTFKLLGEEERTLKPTESAEYTLPGGRKVVLLYAEHDASGAGKAHRVRGSITIEGAKSAARTMFALDEGGDFLLAGMADPTSGGILIYALSCTTGK